MSGLTFREADHVYALDGVEVPSVTTVLQAVGLLQVNGGDPDARSVAMLRGTRVHAAIALALEGRFDEALIEPEDLGYISAARRFLAEAKLRPVLTEHRVVHPRHRYAGTIDCVARGDLGYVLIDWKVSLNPTALATHVQLAAYSEAIRANPPAELVGFKPEHPLQRLGVSLRENGIFRVFRYQNPRDFSTFLAALTVYGEQQRCRSAWTEERRGAA